jgi:hypothetical protein
VGELIFADDFGFVRDSWRQREDPDIVTRIDGGERVILAREPSDSNFGDYIWPDLIQNKSETDIILQVRAYIPSDSAALGYGFVFGWQQNEVNDSKSYFMFSIRREPNRSLIYIDKAFTDKGAEISATPFPDGIPENAEFAHTLTLIISNKTTRGYIDGILVAEKVFEDYNGGPFGIMTLATNTEQLSAVHFDNFRVWRLP